jgi:hypothetical protein
VSPEGMIADLTNSKPEEGFNKCCFTEHHEINSLSPKFFTVVVISQLSDYYGK